MKDKAVASFLVIFIIVNYYVLDLLRLDYYVGKDVNDFFKGGVDVAILYGSIRDVNVVTCQGRLSTSVDHF